MSEPELDAEISRVDPNRLINYNNHRWRREVLDWEEVGLWCGSTGAKGMPVHWCYGSLKETTDLVYGAQRNGTLSSQAPDVDAAMRGMSSIVRFISQEEMLCPIVLPAPRVRTNPCCRPIALGFDDGNMRALTLALAGKQKIPTYVGR
ncbi:MAG TPA: hypothetical protein VGS11_11100 [Candidatus Bathyarchaeia archaeon]|nr:hypothetical protein [Candidatus Bathyarchaeia archaeon]